MDDQNTSFLEQITPMREEIDRIDNDILSLLAQRQQQVEKIVTLKKAHNMPVYHPAREEDLISRLRANARQNAMDEDYIESLYRIILRQSRIKQNRKMELAALRPGARILIVGGRGQMGSLFVRLFSRSGYEVRIMEQEDWDHAEDLCRGIDLALVSVPIQHTADVISAMAPLLPEHAVMADLTSIKKMPLDAMMTAHKGPVLGLHPLFGPTTNSLDKQVIAVCPGREPEASQWVVEQLSLWGAVIVPATAEEHDSIMEIVQALRHFATFCFGSFLYQRQITLARTLEFSSPIYRLELGMVGRLFAQNSSSLYAEIVFATEERRKLLASYIKSLSRHLSMLEGNDKERFVREFNTVSEWFGPFGEQAMRESTFIIDKLIERF